MSFSYNNIIDRSKNNDNREENKDFNKLIMVGSKKKSNQVDVDIMMNKTSEKIFDVITIEDKNFFIDINLSQIWNDDAIIVGIIDDDKFIWFKEQDKLIEEINQKE
jgi:hypothetical protein